MKRIGIAASKIAKGNLLLYNSYVVLIAFLFSLFVFIVSGATVVFAFVIIAYLSNEVIPSEMERNWSSVRMVCMVVLTVVIGIFNLLAISQNIKIQNK